jgi:UDP-N-acetylglucosamine acyltransferase
MTSIHPTAILQPGAQLGEQVTVGPYCVIGPHVRIGDRTTLMSHVVVDGRTTLGRDCKLFPFACIGQQTQDLKFAGGTTYAEIGDGTTLREFATVHTGTRDGETTRIGARCLIMAYCHVAHGCELGDEVILSNSTQLAGEVKIEELAIVAGMVGVHQFCRIGTLAMVGGGTRVTKDVPPYMLIGAEPLSVVGINAVGLQRRGVSAEVRSALKQAFKLLYHDGLNRTQAVERIRTEVPDGAEVRHLIDFFEKSERGVL